MKTVYLVRHGETDGNIKQYSQYPDTELSPAGHEGARALAERFAKLPIDVLFASPFKRAQETADYISQTTGLTTETVESLHEHLRPKEMLGKAFTDENKELFDTYYGEFWEVNKTYPSGENFYDALARTKTALDFISKKSYDSAVVVSHGDFLRLLLTHVLLGQTDDVSSHRMVYQSFSRLSNVAISVIELVDEQWKVKMYNDHTHFAE